MKAYILWVIFFYGLFFSVETALCIDITRRVARKKAKGCLLVYLSSHIDKSYENSRRFVILAISQRQIVMKSPLVV